MKKKLSFVFAIVFTFLINISIALAAPSSSISVNRSKIEVGQSVTATVTVKSAASWNVHINGTGNTNGCSKNEADASSNGKNTTKKFSVTCSANSTGVIKISYSGDATSEDGKNVNISGSKTITVVAKRPKSSNNDLKALSVEGYELTPAFNKNTLEYSVSVPSTVNSIKINATKADNYSRLSGTGEFEVVEGPNLLNVVVTSETGVEKTYKINVIVEDKNPIEVKVDGKTYTLVKNARSLVAPDNYTETTVTISGIEIPAFYNEKTKYTLVGLKDSSGNIGLFVYEDGKYYSYNEIKVDALSIVVLDVPETLKGYQKKNVSIGEFKVDALVVKSNSRFAIVYGVNVITGEKGYYKYDLDGKTISRYDDEMILLLQNKNKTISYIMLGASVAAGVFFILTIALAVANGRKKKLIEKAIMLNEAKNEKVVKKTKAPKKEEVKEEKLKKEIKSEKEEPKEEIKAPVKEEASEETEVYDIFADDKKKKKSKK